MTVAMASRFQVKPSTSKLKAVCAGAMLVLRRVGVEGLVVGFQHVEQRETHPPCVRRSYNPSITG